MDIRKIILEALNKAYSKKDKGDSPRLIHRYRSMNFVECLASELRVHYQNRESIAVLSKHSNIEEHRTRFGLNELLYDILVCDTETVESALEKDTLTYVSKAIWEIESEFARNSREAVYDFNKLVLGSSENKLFIGPQSHNEEAFLKPLAELAKLCNPNTYVALVPHPSEWKKKQPSVHCWRMRDGWDTL